MTGTAANLEDPARWLGIVIAAIGALLTNPDATAHGWTSVSAHITQGASRARGVMARFIPALRKSGTVHPVAGTADTLAVVDAVSARPLLGWNLGAPIDERIAILDQRTRSLEHEMGAFRQTLSDTENQLRADLTATVQDLRDESEAIRQSIDALRLDMVHSDARALPVIVVGVALSGLAPDAARVPMWLGLLVLLVALGLTTWFAWMIVRPTARTSQ